MEHIRQAVDRVRSKQTISPPTAQVAPVPSELQQTMESRVRKSLVALDPAHLERERIVTHQATNQLSRVYDMLRTQALQSMETNGWQFLAITSPSAGCGKTVTATNLAFSIARQPARSILLVDLDLQKPKVAEYLGLSAKCGILSALEGRSSLLESTTEVSCGPHSLGVLPCERSVGGSSEWMASQAMSNVLQAIRREFMQHIVIFDLPPLLVGDDVISILPKMDAVLLIGGAGTTNAAEIKECNKHLHTANVLKIVLNKVPKAEVPYYGY